MKHKELPKVYEPHEVEDHWINRWIDANYFVPTNKDSHAKAYSIVIPPPNVTGSLHMGHALNTTIQDILIRYHRMCGDKTLWVLGTDHAGIATQNVVEKQLHAEKKSRFDLGREKFIERVWKWRKESGGTIINQLKRLGASCDYANERFTMDEGLSAAVRKVFVQLHQEGLIYRGRRLINWCPRCHTALSDLEVEHHDQKGNLWQIRYPLLVARSSSLVEEKSGKRATRTENREPINYLTVATTRPETMLGDTAVAVHPEDERYRHMIGQKVILPLVNRELPIIADEYVDPEFGSGVVKITPAHDFNDFEIGNRHNLEKINILTDDGKINENGGAYAGLTVHKAREKVVEDLKSEELFVDVQPHQHAVGHCYRCKTVVEPYLTYQWFVKTKSLAKPAIEAVKKGKTEFVPRHWEKTYFNWMENIQDWCISRQIWWGHQIPAWYCPSSLVARSSSLVEEKVEGSKTTEDKRAPSNENRCGPIVAEQPPKSCSTCGSTKLTQDEDVLDTWFSSALWPFSTLGWPEETKALKTYYPTSVLVTAFDIIFFWVARMMMMGLHFMKEVPFKHVHIHAIVRDPMGQKMSKSKGNVVDPLLMMKEYGTDAFRFTLAAFAAQGRDIKLDAARISGYRNFCNKIWNASRFAMMSAASFIRSEKDFENIDPQQPINQWIVAELARTIKSITNGIEDYEFNRAAGSFYTFFWHSFCDWYLEFTKEIYREGTEVQKQETARTTFYVLDTSLRLLHPFMPFITEEIWQMLGDRNGKTIVTSPFPAEIKGASKYKHSWEGIQLVCETVTAIRSIRQETGVPLTEPVDVDIVPASSHIQSLYTEVIPMIRKLGKAKEIQFISKEPAGPNAIAKVEGSLIVIPLQGLIDVEKERKRQSKKLEKVKKEIQIVKKKLDNPKFTEHAPKELVEEKRGEMKEALEKKELIEKALRGLGA